MREFEFKTTIEVEIKVRCTIEPAQKGSCDSMGVPEEPSWNEYIEDIEIIFPKEVDKETREQIRAEAEEELIEIREE